MGSSTAQQTLLFGLLVVGFGPFTLSRSFLRTSYVPMVLSFALALYVSVVYRSGGASPGATASTSWSRTSSS